MLNRRHILAGLICLVLGFLLCWRLDRIPSPWFDEGWSFSLARNLVDSGHYGHLRLGEPQPATILNTGWPVLLPMATSFRVFGPGVWQGRLPVILYGIGMLASLYAVTWRLYDLRVADITLCVAVLLPWIRDLNPIWMSKQALGEVPMLCFLLIGFYVMLTSWEDHPWTLAISALVWSLALQSKPQAMPFLVASLAIPSLLAVRHQRKVAARFAIALGLTLVTNGALTQARDLWYSRAVSSMSGNDPYSMVRETQALFTYVLVLVTAARVEALLWICLVGLPTCGALVHAAQRLCKSGSRIAGMRQASEVALLALSGSWLSWYLFLSIGWPRYLFPAFLLSMPFVAYSIDTLSQQRGLRGLLERAAKALHRFPPQRSNMASLFTVVFLGTSVVLNTYAAMAAMPSRSLENDLSDAASYLHTESPPSAILETYESELFFLLDRPYHYPPDEVQHRLNRRTFLGQDVAIDYDALTADPDYLIVGDMARMWGLYDQVLAAGAFRPLKTFGRYEIYQRVR